MLAKMLAEFAYEGVLPPEPDTVARPRSPPKRSR